MLFLIITPTLRTHAQTLSGYCGREVVYNNDSTNLTWQVDRAQHTLTIIGNGPMKDYSTDTKAPWYIWRNDINRVIIGNGVTCVGTYAMYDMQMDSVCFGAALEKIREWAFAYCRRLRSVCMGDNLMQIEYEAFGYNDSLLLVDMGNSPTTIDNYAFNGCQLLRKVRFSRVKNVNWEAFSSCRSLVDLNLGDSLEYLSARAFNGCNSLRKVHLPATLTNMYGAPFIYASVLDTIEVDPANPVFSDYGVNVVVRKDNQELEQGCRQSVIPAETKGIGSYAFEGCSGLQSIVIPEGVEYINSEAFQNCTGLQSVTFPNSITRAECNVFYNCTSLETPVYNNRLFVYMPQCYKAPYNMQNTIREICCGAMQNCDSLVSIRLSDSLEVINSNAMSNCRSLRSLHIPDGVQYIYSSALSSCSSLRSLSFPANLIQLGEGAISYCYSLDTIIWNCKDAHLSWIFYDSNNYPIDRLKNDNYFDWYHPFYSVRKQVRSFTFGDSVQVIPRYLCYEMENLTALSFGCEVDSIEEHVFDGCNSIVSIHWNARNYKDPDYAVYSPFYSIRDSVMSFTFGDSVQHIPAYICNGMSRLHELHIPENVSSIGEYAFRYMGVLDSISVAAGNNHYDSRNACNALIETTTNTLLLGNYKTRIPVDITGIGEAAFRNVRGLSTVVLPKGVKSVGREAFNGCAELKNINLPQTLGAINDYTFQDCDSLYNISLPDSLWYVGLRAFANCTHLQSITLPKSTELLDQYAFSGCTGLQSITCNAVVPPSIQETTFRGSSCPIYVPCPSITDYRTAYIWSDYGNRVAGQYAYQLSVRPNDYTSGRVIVVQQPDCEHNAILLAEPIFGHEFVSWQDTLGNILSVNPQYEFYLDEDKSIVAVFTRASSIEEEDALISKIWVVNHEVKILSNITTRAVLYDLTGHEVDVCEAMAGTEASLQAPAAGVYVVLTEDSKQKVIVK